VLWSQGNPWVMSDLATEGIVVSSSGMASCEPVVGTLRSKPPRQLIPTFLYPKWF
jgi:hypothetical protein